MRSGLRLDTVMVRTMPALDDLLFPDVLRDNWQMMPWERIALTGILARLRPQVSLEIGVYYGGSLSLTSQFVEKIYAIDIDPAVKTRFAPAPNVEIIVGASSVEVPSLLRDLAAKGEDLEFVLVDGDHSVEGVRRDLNLLLGYTPRKPLVILCHDSGNALCREGIRSANWEQNPHVHKVDLDFVPGQLIEHSISGTTGECWGGFAIAYLDAAPRPGPLIIEESAKTSVRSIHFTSKNLGVIAETS